MIRSGVQVIPVVDAGARFERQSVAQRIDRRLEILKIWLAEGITIAEAIPRSLTKLRVWRHDELGIYPIHSPTDFTQTHAIHGPKVRELARLLQLLKERQVAVNIPKKTVEAQFDRRAFDHLLEAVTSQWHAERDKCLTEKKRAESAEAREALLRKECVEKDILIAELRRELSLSSRRGFSVVS